ncbi:MAG TPA: hypothetical protein VGC87_25395 [Pyrinomonadaceae bacterium]|jgi:photosystem II stability/assembly factor-like uncharacterized protein
MKATQLKGIFLPALLLPLLVFLIIALKELSPISRGERASALSGMPAREAFRAEALKVSAHEPSGRVAPVRAIGEPIFVGAGTAWVQNYHGELLLTRDGGESWEPVGGAVTHKFDAFTMIDGRRGWAVDGEGKFWKTDDSGYRWRVGSLLKRKDPREYFTGASQILSTGDGEGYVVSTFAVWRTTDDGSTWNEVNQLSFQNLKRSIHKLYFLNSKLGWALGEGLVLLTNDGGKHWRSVVASLSFDISNTINAVRFLDENRGWMYVDYAPQPFPERAVLFTEDGGKTWQAHNDFNTQTSIYDIFFLDDKTGWMAGDERTSDSGQKAGVLFHTGDGGRTWGALKAAPASDAIRFVRFTSPDEGWLATDYSVYRTHDGGGSWLTVLSYPEVKHSNMQLLGFQ